MCVCTVVWKPVKEPSKGSNLKVHIAIKKKVDKGLSRTPKWSPTFFLFSKRRQKGKALKATETITIPVSHLPSI